MPSAAEGATAAVKPVLSEIALSGSNLIQTDYASLGGTPADLLETAMAPRGRCSSNVTPTPPSSSIFSYYTYSKGKLVQVPPKELGATEANSVIQVKVAFTGFPPQHLQPTAASAPASRTAPCSASPPRPSNEAAEPAMPVKKN